MTILDNIKMNAKYLGIKTKDTWEHHSYKITLKYNNKAMTIDYSLGMAHDVNIVELKSVMSSLLMDNVQDNTLADFCDNFGYDNDSIKAHKIYKACQANTKKLLNLFNQNEIEELNELLQDY